MNFLKPKPSLILAGHGSTLNEDSATPTFRHADRIREMGIFEEVHVSFWKEEANFRETLKQVHTPEVYIVPNFISNGYFTENILPREFGLDGKITKKNDQTIYYTDPVGVHDSMIKVLLHRAQTIYEKENPDLQKTCLFIVGHGTSLNQNSTKIIYDRAEQIRSMGVYGDCQATFMEQTPFIKDWAELSSLPNIIVVPFFISDGLHSYEDIPVLLGISKNVKEEGFKSFTELRGRKIWYASAIGTEDMIVDVILAQVNDFKVSPFRSEGNVDLQKKTDLFFDKTDFPLQIGELCITKEDNAYSITHIGDIKETNLKVLKSIYEIRPLILFSKEHQFRPLKGQFNLSQGWKIQGLNQKDLLFCLDAFYPTSFVNWLLYKDNNLIVTSFKETAERQTGMYKVVSSITAEQLQETIEKSCNAECGKKRLWSPAVTPVVENQSTLPLLCPEACNRFISQCRSTIKGVAEEE